MREERDREAGGLRRDMGELSEGVGGPLVDQPCLTLPPPLSHWIATTQRNMTSKRGTHGRDDLLREMLKSVPTRWRECQRYPLTIIEIRPYRPLFRVAILS